MIFTEELELARNAAAAAGKIIRRYFSEGISGEIKSVHGQDQGQVTAADLEAERAITEQIRKRFPSHQIMAEEEHTEIITAKDLWVIDPLDGTNNFAHGVPHFAVSIAHYHQGEATCGVVHDPIRDDWFVAAAGQGSWLNKRQVKVNSNASLPETLVALGFYYDRGELMKRTLAAMQDFYESQVQGVRRFGSAALDLAYVGAGWYGGYFEYTLNPWDFAAGRLFVEEAGGKVTDCAGESVELKSSSLLATNSLLHDSMLKIVRAHL